jgi:multidrug efflux system outer membrane protein
LIIAGAPEYPNVNVAASATRSSQSRTTAFSFGPTMQNSFQTGFDASWELDIFGGTRRNIESAKANLEVSEENRGNVLISVLSEVARDYVQMRAYQQRLIITYNNLKTQRDSLDIADARFKSGLTSELNVAQQKAQLASTAAQIPTLEMGLEQTIHAIGVLLAKDPGALRAELIKNGPIPEVNEPNVPVGVPSELLRRRPDVRLAERQLAAATAQIGVAAAQLYPSITLTGSIGLESAKTNHLLNRHSEFWSAGPGLSWPIFNAGQLRANVRLQKAITEEGMDNYQQTVLSAMQDVEDSMTAYIKEQARMRQLRVAVRANERSLQLSQDMYQKGLTDFLNVLTAQAALFAAEDQLAQSDGNVSQDVIALYKALGGGWLE